MKKKEEEVIHAGASEFVDNLIHSAIESHASDIHLDPGRDTMQLRYRVDGVLYPVKTYPMSIQEEMAARVKVLAQLDITERRVPQDGHIEIKFKEKEYNLRVSTAPSVFGEAIVLRILNREDILSKLDNLGFDQDQLVLIRELIASPHGLILNTGPTGSGKTTLMYSILDELNEPSRNIITLEDPVELEMENLRQIQINEVVNLTFANAVRAVLRQNPDIIMLGEIRDADTGQMAFRAALSGILVFSTFHTYDVVGLVIRMIEMGVPRSVIAYGLTGVVSTRLVRKVCTSCKEPYQLSESDRSLYANSNTPGNFQKGKGCDVCIGSGYAGRTGIFEIVAFNDDIRNGILENIPNTQLRDIIARSRKKSLRHIALERAAQGVTTIEEVRKVIGSLSEETR